MNEWREGVGDDERTMDSHSHSQGRSAGMGLGQGARSKQVAMLHQYLLAVQHDNETRSNIHHTMQQRLHLAEQEVCLPVLSSPVLTTCIAWPCTLVCILFCRDSLRAITSKRNKHIVDITITWETLNSEI